MPRKKKKQTRTKRTSAGSRAKRTQRSVDQAVPLDRLLASVRANPDDVDAALVLAEYYDSNKLQDRVLSVLEPLERLYPFSSMEQRVRFNRLLAFAYVRERRLIDAERVISRGLKETPDSLDLCYALTYQRASLGEHEDALTSGEKYLSLFDNRVSDSQGDRLTRTDQHKSQLLNFMATTYRQTSQLEKAAATFEESIATDPRNHLPYLNLANLYVQMKRWQDAQLVVDRGLKNCQQVEELQMLLDSYKRKTTISACMIVKNEEELLERCLESIRDWVDEIILVDTGSTDRTVEIAKSYGATIFHQPWEGDFSKARNYSLEQATCDWVFVIDADECFYEEDVPKIIRLLNETEYSFISVNVLNVYGENEENMTFLPSERFFKRELNLRYTGIVHNQLEVPDGLRALRTDIRIKHYGYGLDPEKMRQKLARSRSLLEKQLAENPENAFANFNFAQLLRAGEDGFPKENAPEIIRHATRGVELTDPSKNKEKHIHLMCLDQLAWTHFYIDEYDKAEEYAQRALRIKSDYLDPLLLMGHIYCQKKDYDPAILHYKKYIEAQAAYDPAQELTNVILFHVDSRVSAYYALAMISLMKKEAQTAKEYYHKTLKLNPRYLEANSHLGRILFEENRFEEAESCFLKQLELGMKSYEAALGLAAIYLQRKDYEKAENHYLLALEIQPDDIPSLLKLARLYMETGRKEEASQCFEKAAEVGGSDTGVEKELAGAYFSAGQYEKAASVYTKLIECAPGDAELCNDLGNCHFKQGNLAEAEKCYVQALQYSPPLDIAYRNLGLTRIRLERPKEAIVALEKYLAVNPSEHDLLHLVGDLYAKMEDYQSALPVYEKCLTLHPDDAAALYSLSECYLHMGHIDSAILGYRQVLQIDPDFKPAQDRLNALPRLAGKA